MKKISISLSLIYIAYAVFFFYFKNDFLLKYSGIAGKLKNKSYVDSLDYFNDYKQISSMQVKLNYALVLASLFILFSAIFLLAERKYIIKKYMIVLMIIISSTVLLISLLSIAFTGYTRIF